MSANGTKLPTGIHTVALGMGDLNGIMRGKRIPASHWPTVCVEGNALSMALLAIDMTSDIWDTPYVSLNNGYPDMHMFPAGPVYPLPWEVRCRVLLGACRGHGPQAGAD
jgi:glutamine synthetase